MVARSVGVSLPSKFLAERPYCHIVFGVAVPCATATPGFRSVWSFLASAALVAAASLTASSCWLRRSARPSRASSRVPAEQYAAPSRAPAGAQGLDPPAHRGIRIAADGDLDQGDPDRRVVGRLIGFAELVLDRSQPTLDVVAFRQSDTRMHLAECHDEGRRGPEP